MLCGRLMRRLADYERRDINTSAGGGNIAQCETRVRRGAAWILDRRLPDQPVRHCTDPVFSWWLRRARKIAAETPSACTENFTSRFRSLRQASEPEVQELESCPPAAEQQLRERQLENCLANLKQRLRQSPGNQRNQAKAAV